MAVGPCPTVIQIVGRPGTGSLPSTIAPPDHPQYNEIKVIAELSTANLYVRLGIPSSFEQILCQPVHCWPDYYFIILKAI